MELTRENLLYEKYALEAEKEEERKLKELSSYYEEKYSLIESLLERKDDRSREELLKLFNEKEFRDRCYYRNEFAPAFMLLGISKEELNHPHSVTVLDLADNMDDYVRFITDIKFLLLRLEFAKDPDTISILFNVIHSNDLSVFMMIYMVNWCSLDKEAVFNMLADRYEEDGEPMPALLMRKSAEAAGQKGGKASHE